MARQMPGPAIQTTLEMPFFRRKPQPDDDGYYPTGIDAAAVTAGTLYTAEVAGKTAIITRVQGELLAFSSVCPHAAADLSKGRLFDGQIKCPDHGYTFDVRTGRATWPRGEGCHLTRFEAREKGGSVEVRPTSPAARPRDPK